MRTMIFIVSVLGMMLTSSVGAKIIPSDGLWQTYDDPAIGSGINIRTQGDITMVIVYTYRDDGSPVWYFATGEIDANGVFRAAMGETKNGENLFNDNPQTADIVNPNKTIELVFNATETGMLSINDSEPKPIHTYRFGIEGIETAQLTTPSGDSYQFPDITGQWVMGNADDNFDISFNFYTYYGGLQDPPEPNFPYYYLNDFIQSGDISHRLRCPTLRSYDEPYCEFRVDPYDIQTSEKAELLSRLYVFLDDIGMNTMTFHLQPKDDDSYSRDHPVYQAFRLNTEFEDPNDIDTRTFPSEGLWRTLDDPHIGSGINFHSQDDVVMMTVYTYDDNGDPIWYMTTGELMTEDVPGNSYNANSWFSSKMFSTKNGTPIESSSPMAAEVDQVLDVTLLLSGQQLAQLSQDTGDFKTIQGYQFGYPEFVAGQFFDNGDPLKFASPEGWWLMAEENGSESALLHLVKESNNKLSPPPPTDWVRFNNVAPTSSWIDAIRCPKTSAGFWNRCQVFMTVPDNAVSNSLQLTNIGVDAMRIYHRDENRTDIGDYPYYYFYYNFYRINPPMQP